MDFNDYDRGRSRYNFNSRIMITATVCLFFVVVVIVVLHFYARFVLRRQAMRRQAIHQLAISTAAAQVNSSEQTRAGLDAAVIASLPIFIYKVDDDQVDRDCAVCLSNLEQGEVARFLPNCKHIFHSQCIDAWLRANSTCPICRTEAKPRVQPDSVEMGVVVSATAPPVDSVNSSAPCSEGTSDGLGQPSKALGSSSRLSSFRRILSREKSDRRLQPNCQTESIRDLETQ